MVARVDRFMRDEIRQTLLSHANDAPSNAGQQASLAAIGQRCDACRLNDSDAEIYAGSRHPEAVDWIGGELIAATPEVVIPHLV